MAAQLIVAAIVIPLDRCVLDHAVHSFDLTVCPWVIWFGQPVFNPIGRANHVEAHRPGIGSIPVSGPLCELGAVANGRSDQWRNHWRLG